MKCEDGKMMERCRRGQKRSMEKKKNKDDGTCRIRRHTHAHLHIDKSYKNIKSPPQTNTVYCEGGLFHLSTLPLIPITHPIIPLSPLLYEKPRLLSSLTMLIQ